MADRGESKMRRTLPAEVAAAVNLMAHPVAGLAALSAIGLGMAGHALGIWAGAVAGAAETTRRMLELAPDASQPHPAEKRNPPATPAREATDRLMAEAKHAGGVAAPTSRPVAQTRAKPAAEAKPAKVVAFPVARQRQPKALERPAAPDDLKAIGGIGPKLEQVLNGLGIWTYAQIAALTAPEISWIDDHLSFAGRITRDDWIGQASRLAAGSVSAAAPARDTGS